MHTFVGQKTQLGVFFFVFIFLPFLGLTKIYSNIFILSFTDLLPQQVRNNALCITWRCISLRLFEHCRGLSYKRLLHVCWGHDERRHCAWLVAEWQCLRQSKQRFRLAEQVIQSPVSPPDGLAQVTIETGFYCALLCE